MSQSILPVLTEQPVDNLPTLTFEEYRFYEGEIDVQYELYKGKLIPMPIATVLHIWSTKTAYADAGADYYQQKYRQRIVSKLEKTAESFGFELVAKTPQLD